MKIESGEIRLNTSKHIAYVPQQAYIMNATVEENIRFGKKFNQKR